MSETEVQIGIVRVHEPCTRRIGYECAAWYKDVQLTPGEYPLRARIDDQGRVIDTSISAALPGVVTDDCFDSLFCGNIISLKRNQHVGEQATYHTSPYAHALALSILRGEAHGALEYVLQGYEARRIPFEYVNVHGQVEHLETAGIFRV